jgi:hypothetical protein
LRVVAPGRTFIRVRALIASCLVAIAMAPAVPIAAPQVATTETGCLAQLDRLGVKYQRAKRAGIAIGVAIDGPLGGVTYHHDADPLVIDCSLAVSLAEAGRYLSALGVDRAGFSSAYSKRNVRGTNRPSKHSYGLAIDVHTFTGGELGTLRIVDDYEQGLGDAVDCIGAPLTRGGAVLVTAKCQLARSGLFYLVLTPDYDDAHHNHFHLEARPWTERGELRAATAAIH